MPCTILAYFRSLARSNPSHVCIFPHRQQFKDCVHGLGPGGQDEDKQHHLHYRRLMVIWLQNDVAQAYIIYPNLAGWPYDIMQTLHFFTLLLAVAYYFNGLEFMKGRISMMKNA
jgi:hypothetical protein